ncbi:Cytochrome P450 85A1 [Rhynchospora pubera]|uniref:Cytochrome P450 85A1 n=1 Tax=Rhynchospora pubera TaxID=906938 RepID=A0AAV8H179_9POAL|nr:Cytochrome P450 85A1 [Rhynchospora pubera]
MLLVLKLVASTEGNIALTKELEEAMHQVSLSFFTVAINLPGTTYNKGLKARRKLVQMLGKLVEERRASKCSRSNDILDTILKNSEDTNCVIQTDEQIIDQIIAFVLSGYETASIVLMMAVKYLHDHPLAQDELRKENLEIRKGNLGKPENYTLNWDDYRSMSFTRSVVLEALRMASIGLGFLRRTTVDTEIKGYVIPKGWTVFVSTVETNKDPDTYPEPLKWEEIGENKIVRFPRVEAPNGLYYRLRDC